MLCGFHNLMKSWFSNKPMKSFFAFGGRAFLLLSLFYGVPVSYNFLTLLPPVLKKPLTSGFYLFKVQQSGYSNPVLQVLGF